MTTAYTVFSGRRTTRSPTRSLRDRNAQCGVALIEALISILIFAFGVLGLIGLEARAINFSADAEDRNRAALFASEVASSMWVNGNLTLPAATLATYNSAISDPTNAEGLPAGVLTITPVVVTPTGPPGPVTINAADITITWQPPSDGTTTSAATVSSLTTRVILP